MTVRRVDTVPRHLTRYTQQHIIATPNPNPQAPIPLTATASPAELRGIPAIGRGVAGAIPGTSPHHAVR